MNDTNNQENKYNILVVDRTTEQAGLVKVMLKGFTKADVNLAYSVDEAMKYITNNKVDLVLTELSLPGEDGYALLRKVKDISDIPVIAQTAFGFNDDKFNCLEAGFSDYMLKPHKLQEINAVVQKYLK